MNLKVAVIIPTLNEECFIKRCLDSVCMQTYPFAEMDVMVVDGGSKDNTCEIVRSYAMEYPNVRLLHNPKKIQSAAFNLGCANTNADIMIRLDAHVIYNKVYVCKCVEHLKTDKILGNVGGICDIQPQYVGLIPEANALLNKSHFGIGGAEFRVGAGKRLVDTVPFGAFPKTVVNNIGGMREDLPRGEDNEYNHRIRKAGYNILLDPEIVATYFARDTIWRSMRQMYQNGMSIAKLTEIDIDIINIRHFVPLLFVCALFGGVLIGTWCQLAFLFICCIVALYVFLDVLASLAVCKEHGVKYMLVLPIMFPAIHLSYGYGTLNGLMGGVKRRCKFWLLAVLILPFHIVVLTIKLLQNKI